jgi:hypothetical protein
LDAIEKATANAVVVSSAKPAEQRVHGKLAGRSKEGDRRLFLARRNGAYRKRLAATANQHGTAHQAPKCLAMSQARQSP